MSRKATRGTIAEVRSMIVKIRTGSAKTTKTKEGVVITAATTKRIDMIRIVTTTEIAIVKGRVMNLTLRKNRSAIRREILKKRSVMKSVENVTMIGTHLSRKEMTIVVIGVTRRRKK